MQFNDKKNGRPRRYDFKPPADFANERIAFAAAVMEELSARVYDQISDLPTEALNFVPKNNYLSIAKLILHLAWGEAGWVARITGSSIPGRLADQLRPGNLNNIDESYSTELTASELFALCTQVRTQITLPAISVLDNPFQEIQAEKGPKCVIEVLMHLTWHWTFPSGHIGMLRLEWGSEYYWNF